MPALRTQKSHLRAQAIHPRPKPRLSSPHLPEALLPRGDRALLQAAQEGDRAMLNADVSRLQDAAIAAPLDKVKTRDYLHLLDDYQNQYGDFVRDADNTAFLTRREEALASLWARRETIALTPLSDNDKLINYFDDVDCFEAEFGMSADSDDDNSVTIDLKRQALTQYQELMHRADDDLHRASDYAGEMFQFRVHNPFAKDDDRRLTFDGKLRSLLASFRRDDKKFDITKFPNTLTRDHWMFYLPNPYPQMTQRRLDYWCYRFIFREQVLKEVEQARELASNAGPAGSTVPSCTFYGQLCLLFNERLETSVCFQTLTLNDVNERVEAALDVEWVDLCGQAGGLSGGVKARRSLKTLPCLPPSPYDRKIARRHRCRRTTTPHVPATTVSSSATPAATTPPYKPYYSSFGQMYPNSWANTKRRTSRDFGISCGISGS
ncbi:hypothetical protein B0H11DRAFT_2244947 [Mycena galericulata]|nr:hypothetical protein B0H11DRAFT_2244947 [Mycena galericulata]